MSVKSKADTLKKDTRGEEPRDEGKAASVARLLRLQAEASIRLTLLSALYSSRAGATRGWHLALGEAADRDPLGTLCFREFFPDLLDDCEGQVQSPHIQRRLSNLLHNHPHCTYHICCRYTIRVCKQILKVCSSYAIEMTKKFWIWRVVFYGRGDSLEAQSLC